LASQLVQASPGLPQAMSSVPDSHNSPLQQPLPQFEQTGGAWQAPLMHCMPEVHPKQT